MNLTPDELQRLAGDEEIMDAVEVLRLWGVVDGAAYDRLIQLSMTKRCRHTDAGKLCCDEWCEVHGPVTQRRLR